MKMGIGKNAGGVLMALAGVKRGFSGPFGDAS